MILTIAPFHNNAFFCMDKTNDKDMYLIKI